MLVHNQNVRVLISVVVRVRDIVIKVEEEVSGEVPGKGWGQPREKENWGEGRSDDGPYLISSIR